MRIEDLTDRLAGSAWTLERVLPRDAEHALVQLRDGSGTSVAGQWFADPGRARRVAAQTADGAGAGLVEQPFTDLVVQRAGTDRRLRGLADRCSAAGAKLRAHRPERRAVVEIHEGGGSRFVKVVRPERLGSAQVRAMTLRVPGVPTPRVLDVDLAAGTVTTAALTGSTLHEAIADPDLGEQMVEVGRTLAHLHAAPLPDEVARHGPEAEIAVVDRWWRLAEEYGAAAPRTAVTAARARLAELLSRSSASNALLHRDLHDKQVVLGNGGPGLLDLDLLAVGDPALDLANLVVHLELRARQGALPPSRAIELTEHLVAGYAPDPRTLAALPGYLLATRLRLVALYAFRPASAAAAAELLTDPLIPA